MPTYIPKQKNHYPYITQSILRLMRHGLLTNVVAIDVEPTYGYVVRLTYTNGKHRIIYGNDLGLNNAAACSLAKDKGYTKFLLRTIGVQCPEGAEFILPWWEQIIGQSQRERGNTTLRTMSQAAPYIQQEMGYPVYIKPVHGSKGADIFIVHNKAELDTVTTLYNEKHVRMAMVEAPINMPDYRVVVLDGELISAYRRVPLTVVGDGMSTVGELIEALQQRFFKDGRDIHLNVSDERIRRHLAKHGMTIQDVPKAGISVTLIPISNLSAGGTSEDVTTHIHKRWIELATQVAESFNLRLIGLDLACEAITSPNAQYSVIEVNSSPGLDHFALSGEVQKEAVDHLYLKVLNVPPSRCDT